MIGIYKLIFEDNSCYIGQSTNLEHRFSQHKYAQGKGSPKLEKAFLDSKLLSLEVIEECSLEELDNREIFWISTIKPALNTLPGGVSLSGLNHPRAKYSKEQIEEVVELFVTTDIRYAQITDLTEVATSTVHDICKGRSHTWATKHLDLEEIRARRDNAKSIVIYDPNNVKYVVEYGSYSEFIKKHDGISVVNLHNFKNKIVIRNAAGWSTYEKPSPAKLTLISDEGIEFSGTCQELKEIMKEFSLARYSQLRILDGYTSKGWRLKQSRS